MTHSPHILIFSLVFITITSSQVPFYFDYLFLISSQQSIHSPKYHHDKILSSQNPQSSMDLHYLDACTAILKGVNDVDSTDFDYWYYFAEWENINSDGTVNLSSGMFK